MARVTVEDCVTIIPNRFELVLLASQRARDISAGVNLTVERDNDKNAVVALREISEQSVDFEELRRHIVRGVNRHADLNLEDDNLMTITTDAIPTAEDFEGSAQIEEISFESPEVEAADVEAADESEAEIEEPATEEPEEVAVEVDPTDELTA